MGDKIRAKQMVEAAGVPVVPGVHRAGLTDADLVAAADAIGYPVLLKPSAGGGGKGMRRVDSPQGMTAAVAASRRESRSAFGDDSLLIERFVVRPRHLEIQIIADSHGGVVHLGERECTLQRRHQKIIEEAPSHVLDEAGRAVMGEAAVSAARSCGYVGAGTVEFIVAADQPDAFYFMEMNTRLQVEHPVTELVTGVDLVETQVRVAAGERLPWGQDQVRINGHAVEARVYAEDPARDFLPTGGAVLRLREPSGDHVRVDSGLFEGMVVGSRYDPMLAKVVAWAEHRDRAIDRLEAALADTVVLGFGTNVAFLRALLDAPQVRSAHLDTGLVERIAPDLVDNAPPADAVRAVALATVVERERRVATGDLFDGLVGWRLGGSAWVEERLIAGDGSIVSVAVRGDSNRAMVRIDDSLSGPFSVQFDDFDLMVTDGELRQRWAYAAAESVRWVGREGGAWPFTEAPRHAVVRPQIVAVGGPVLSPMPGMLTASHVELGDVVEVGQPLVSVEAMKMEHVVRAPSRGVVCEVLVDVGAQVSLDQPLVVLEAE